MATFENGANNKKEMPMVPNRMANAGMEIYLPYNLTLRPEIQYVGNAFLSGDNDNNTEKLEAYTLLNFYVHYKPTFGRLNMTAFVGVDNIADKKYSSYGWIMSSTLAIRVFPSYPNFYYPMPGRTFKGGISLTF